jgi:5-methyltetrahydropteroyltriglutamate--homocysteine methyltransferase
MPQRSKPPFRADHVGSFLRPAELLDARDRYQRGLITGPELREAEDRAITEIVRYQENLGLQGITDGEFRRTSFHLDFLEKLEGVEVKTGLSSSANASAGAGARIAPPMITVTGKLRHRQSILGPDCTFLKSVTKRVPKITLPSPTMLHFRGGREGISKDAYPDLEAFYEEVAACYRHELESLGQAGCTYVQIDDTNLAYLCDPQLREGARQRGDDPNELPSRYAKLINAAIAARPVDMTVCVHLCRGNFRSSWAAEGGYEPVAEVLFSELAVDGYFLEYDDARSGDFSPLRFLPKGKTVVLGLVSTKVGELETQDLLKRRIETAARIVPLDQLCLSPQCGFSSTVHGNAIARESQTAKLRLVIETAREVWSF